MVQIAEFEEKTYEKYFGQEVSRRISNTFPPGQFDEAVLGFDDSFFVPFFCRNIHFRCLFPRWFTHFPGFALRDVDYLIDEMDREFPQCRLNLFVQYKRPDYVVGHRAAEWHLWSQPYFRYSLTGHQQLALERLDQHSNGRAAVIYASPAFWESAELYKCANSGRVVAESNIAQVSSMVGHARFTYVKSGNVGIAHSEPEAIDGPTLDEILNKGLENEKLGLKDHILRTAKMVSASYENDELGMRLFESATEAVLFRGGLAREVSFSQLAKAFAKIEAFGEIADVQLYIA